MTGNVIVGLDIGTSKICAVIAEYNDRGELEITGFGMSPSAGIRKGSIVNIQKTIEAITEAVESAEQSSGLDVKNLSVSISGGNIEGLNSTGVCAVSGKGREITQEDVNRAIDSAKAIVIPMDRDILHVIPQEFIVDDQVGNRNPIDMIGVRLESYVHLITGSISSIQNYVKCVNRGGLQINSLHLEGIVSSEAVLSQDEKDLGTVLIDIGGGTTDVMVYLGGAPYYTHVLPIGSMQISSDLSIVLETPLDIAEKIKINSGCCWASLVSDQEEVMIPGVGGRPVRSTDRRQVCEIIQPRIAEILSMVKHKLEKKGYLSRLGGGVVLTGGGSRLPGISELTTDIFRIPARVGVPPTLRGMTRNLKSPEFSSVLGVILLEDQKRREGLVDVSSPGKQRKEKRANSFLNWLKEFF